MAYQPSEGSNSAFASGVQHQVNPARGNAGSITLGNPGLDQTTQNQAALTPHAVLSTTPAAVSSGIDFEGMQRLSGNPSTPGAYGRFSDELAGGADSSQIAEE
jgi:hypothetical protein